MKKTRFLFGLVNSKKKYQMNQKKILDVDNKLDKKQDLLFQRITITSENSPLEYYRRYVFINYIYFSCFIAHAAYGFIFRVIDFGEIDTNAKYLAFFCLLNAAIYLFCILLNIKGFPRTDIVFFYFFIEIHVFILLSFFTFVEGGFHYLLFPVVAVLFLISFEKTKLRIVWAVSDSLIFVGLNYFLNHWITEIKPYLKESDLPPNIDILLFINTYATFFFLGFAGYYYSQYAVKAEKMLQKIATTDELTGLSNRRDFIEKYEMESARFDRNKRIFSIVMGDIDHFKKFNDTYGHECGDYVLSKIAKIIKDSLRQLDILGRWGGEEFIILLPETNLEDGDRVADKIRNTIESNTFSFKNQELNVTMSFGVSVYDHAMSMEEVIDKADQCLYYAKEAGRNCVIALKE